MAALIPSGCGEETATPPAQARSWYSGGTVHNVDAARWSEVDARNRLATCADLVTKALLEKGVPPNALVVDKLKPWAMELEACITRSFESAGGGRVQEAAAECLGKMELRWPPPG
jgi:hypothetical protein